jgi:glycosyltransferase involved in cell wall biosynthesis
MMTMPSPETDYYFRRFGYCPRQIAAPVPPDLGLVVVIPCFNEPGLIASLESLRRCQRPACAVEVIVVINAPADASKDVRLQNQASLASGREWAARWSDSSLGIHVLDSTALPPKHAGVGLARKIGMDEALRRLDDAGRPDGVIAGYDADCSCAENFLVAIERQFREKRCCPGCSIHFEHRAEGTWPAGVREGIAAYELHLRYYIEGLRHSGLPHAHHTIGSCMAVRAAAYRGQGGMNKRKAGEDFYFLHKIISLGGFADLTTTTVYPSPRPSDRVPFGTGRAVSDFLDRKEQPTYPLGAFLDLGKLFEATRRLYRPGERWTEECTRDLPDAVRGFLASQGFTEVMKEIHENTADEAAFRKRFFRWLDGFRAMKFLHYARDKHYGAGRIEREAFRLLSHLALGEEVRMDGGVEGLLTVYRRLERGERSGLR